MYYKYIHKDLVESPSPGGSIYVGIGLSGKKELSQGVPLDILPYIFTVIFAKKKYQQSKLYILIADEHAFQNTESKRSEVEKVTNRLQDILQKIVLYSGFNDSIEIIRASSLVKYEVYTKKIEQYKKILESDYLARELADIWYFFHEKDTQIKVSWKDPKGNLTYDESFFDDRYKHLEDEEKSFIYTLPGFDFRKDYKFASPYTWFDDQLRLSFNKSSSIEEQIEYFQKNLPITKKEQADLYYQMIIDIVEDVKMEKINGDDIWSKIAQIYNEIMNQ